MTRTIYALYITSITNNLLIKDGWKVGDFVSKPRSKTYSTSVDRVAGAHLAGFYRERVNAQQVAHDQNDSFVGVTFGIAAFRRIRTR